MLFIDGLGPEHFVVEVGFDFVHISCELEGLVFRHNKVVGSRVLGSDRFVTNTRVLTRVSEERGKASSSRFPVVAREFRSREPLSPVVL